MLDSNILKETLTTQMPFGKYKGTVVADLPTYYLEWFHSQGFPKGKLGMLLATVYEIKTNGLEDILVNLQKLKNT